MTTFNLFRLPTGRLVLETRDPKPSDDVVETVKAKDYGEAREKLRVHGLEKYEHRPGYGYF